MRRNIFKEIKGDLLIVLLDAIAVNAAWLLALFLRYYVDSRLLPAAHKFLEMYLRFAPFYTIICIVLFSEFGLYHGIWKNAQFRDLGRIVGANVGTLVVYLILTSIFQLRLPFNVCLLATAIQLALILIIRYTNRIIKGERWKIEKRRGQARNVLVIGDDKKGRTMIKLLSTDSKYKPVVIVGETDGAKVFNIPVVKTDDYRKTITDYKANCVIVANRIVDNEKLKEIEDYCRKKDIEFIDYSVSSAKLLLTIPLFTLIKMFFRGLVWEFFYEWE